MEGLRGYNVEVSEVAVKTGLTRAGRIARDNNAPRKELEVRFKMSRKRTSEEAELAELDGEPKYNTLRVSPVQHNPNMPPRICCNIVAVPVIF